MTDSESVTLSPASPEVGKDHLLNSSLPKTNYGSISVKSQGLKGVVPLVIVEDTSHQPEEPANDNYLAFHKQHHRDCSKESGFETDRSRKSSSASCSSVELELPPNLVIQEKKLFRYMEERTLQVELELKKMSLTDEQVEEGGNLDMNSTILTVNTDDDDFETIAIESEYVSIENERKPLKSAFGVLYNLKHEILRLKGYLKSKCAKLSYLITNDDEITSEEAQKLMENGDEITSEDAQKLMNGLSLKQQIFMGRLDGNLNRVREHMDAIRHKNDIIINGVRLSKNRRYSESPINKLIRKSPIDCVTWFHAVLFLVLLSTLCFMVLWSNSSNKWAVYLRLLRSPLLVVLLLYLYGINMKVWAMFKVDYIAIFSHPPQAVPTPKYIFKIASFLTVLMTVLVIGVLVATPYSIKLPIKIIPVVMWLVLLAFLLNPFDVFLRRARLNFFLTFLRVLLSPSMLLFVYFTDFFLADQFNSCVAVFLDIQYLICYLSVDPWDSGEINPRTCTSSRNGIRPVVSLLPSLWRFFQCLRCFYDTHNVKHLVNAGKYFSTFPVVIFAALFSDQVKGNIQENFHLSKLNWILICWLLSLFVHAIYTFLWDVCCDWGLWNLKCSAFQRKLVYRRKAVYAVAVVFDFILRFLWTLKLTQAIVWEKDFDLIYTGLIIAEILRRFIWNFFRVEYAHVLSEK